VAADVPTRKPGDLPGPIEGGRPTLDRNDDAIHWWASLDDPITGEGDISVRIYGTGDNQIVFPAIDSVFLALCDAAPPQCEQMDELLAGGE